MTQRLQGRTALVTGSTSNIGRAIAQALAAEGAHVIVSGRDQRRGDAVVRDIRAAGGVVDLVRADLDGTPEASHALAAAAADVLGGRIDVLVNNAGIYRSAPTLADTDSASFDRLFAVNVKAPYFLTQAVAPRMVADGGGVVVNLGSWVARLAGPTGGAYAATKAAVESLTRSWAAELGPRGVRVNAVSPGVIRPPDLDPSIGFSENMTVGTPAGAPGHPDAIAAAVVYLASDDARFVHGTVLDVDGGRTGVAVVAA
ncbi:SDR family NAD(P)-dependent oxidoreductase [Promicromonospora thailandica]|uniref:NAD(P)-dependent dehydrogenase, short-chain alcohol dehydrogenase family n=1 Tax=Promicromonospora thailandica TaxID=765201 RepID=A0A9X2FZJ3_9MICO|nr:SDR family oxidoreductase [Promicromonospora thailandica]MCP2264277.1 NAD(P)-dependent dehydrogenase, short-chain alcohol dehydrogenase family [Promicromonospora thailandica]